MELLWQQGEMSAAQIAQALADQWQRNTVYTLIRRCIEKGAIERRDPGFICRAVIPQGQVRTEQAQTLVDTLFDGSAELLFASMLDGRRLTAEEAERMHRLIEAAQNPEGF